MKLVRMKAGHGDVLLAEGDPELADDEERLIAEFRRQLDLGMWAAVPTADRGQRARRSWCATSTEVPRDAERVIFFPQGRGRAERGRRAEQRARELLRAVVDERDFEAYERARVHLGRRARTRGYAYLVYPHRPLVAYDTATGELLRRVLRRLSTTTASGCRTPTTCSPSGCAAGRRARPDRGRRT